MGDTLSGRTARKQYALAAEAQAEQRAALAKQQANLDAIEAGQRRVAQGGGGGLLAFSELIMPEDETLAQKGKKLGGGGANLVTGARAY